MQIRYIHADACSLSLFCRSSMDKVGIDSNGWTVANPKHSHQRNSDGDSCGIICCIYAEFFTGMRRSLIFETDRQSMNSYRWVIWQRMIAAAKNAYQICRRCGEIKCPRNVGGKKDLWVSVFLAYYNY